MHYQEWLLFADQESRNPKISQSSSSRSELPIRFTSMLPAIRIVEKISKRRNEILRCIDGQLECCPVESLSSILEKLTTDAKAMANAVQPSSGPVEWNCIIKLNDTSVAKVGAYSMRRRNQERKRCVVFFIYLHIDNIYRLEAKKKSKYIFSDVFTNLSNKLYPKNI